MKIIFLDVDGVLNGYNKWNLLGWKIVHKINYKPLISFYKKVANPFDIHTSKVRRLAKIVRKTNAKIVMSSSWRFGWWNTKDSGDNQPDCYKKLTKLFKKYNIEVIDITPRLDTRGHEIEEWLYTNKDKIFSFVIIDDESFDMGIFKSSDRFIQTSDIKDDEIIKGYPYENTGLKTKHISKCIDMLKVKAYIHKFNVKGDNNAK